MEIDAVADCNRDENMYRRKKIKTPMFADHPVMKMIKEPGSADDQTPKISRAKTDSITASLLAISDKADFDYYRQKARKRISDNNFGPWFLHEKWLPRKTRSQGRNRKRSTHSSLSPTMFQSPDERRSLRCRYTEPSSMNCEEHTQAADDTGKKQEDLDIKGNCTRIRPATVPVRNPPHLNTNMDSNEIANQTMDGDQPYPKHSLPTLITLRPADSSNCYDTVFSLGKSSLSKKDIIISMRQSNNSRLSTHYRRQAKSALVCDTDADTQTPVQANCPHRSIDKNPNINIHDCSRNDAQNENDLCILKRGSNAIDAINRRKPAPPMCEYMDISQHIRHYRLYHTVRHTGRSSLANDVPMQKAITSVQWDEVFPHRPLPNPTASDTTVPVFRFSVSDFRREPIIIETDGAANEKREIATKAHVIKTDLHRVTSHKTKPKLMKATIAGASESSTAANAKGGLQKKDIKISLSPTVRPVMKSPRTSLTLDGVDDIDKLCSGSGNGKLKRESSKSEEGSHIDCISDGEGGNLTTMMDVDGCKLDRDDFSTGHFPNDLVRNESHTKGEKLNGWNSLETKGEGDTEKTITTSRLSKTQAYIQSSYSVYNDTIQNVSPSEHTQCSDYKEFLKRKKKIGNISQGARSLDCDNISGNAGVDDCSLSDPYYELVKSKLRSPHKFSHILKDLMGFSRYKSYYGNLESARRDDDTKVQQPDDDQRPESSLVRSASRFVKRSRATLSIDTQQLRDSVERKIYEGNKVRSRPLTCRSVEYNDRFVRFLVKEELDSGVRHQNNAVDKTSKQSVGTASTYDLNETCDVPPTDVDKSLTENDLHGIMASSPSTSSGGGSPSATANTSKVWKPNASRWCKKPPTSRQHTTSSAFHYRPASSSASAYVIATPPTQMGFDDRGVVLPLDDFVHMTMKSREGSFSALSQSVNAGSKSKVGIAPNTPVRNSSVRKTSDDGFVRLVSFATPVNQFIFAKRITGYPLASNSTLHSAVSPTTTTAAAEEAGRDVFQRKTAGTFRLSLSDVKQSNAYSDDDKVSTTACDSKMAGEDKMADDLNITVTDLTKTNDPSDSNVHVEKCYATSPHISNAFHEEEGEEEDKDSNACRKIDVNMHSLLKSVELDDTNDSCKDEEDFQLQDERGQRDTSPADDDNISLHSALRKKVVRLAEMKQVNDTTLEEDTDQTECFNGHNKLNSLLLYADDPRGQDDFIAHQTYDSLASKFSQLRQRRKKALLSNNIIKQTSTFVRKSFPPETLHETLTTGRLKLTSSGTEGHSPWRQSSLTSRRSQRPKTVRFACDCDDIKPSDHFKNTE